MHLIPTSASWLNQVERFIALLTDKKIRRGVYRSVAALRTDITSFIDRQRRSQTVPPHRMRANFWFMTLDDGFP